MKFVFLQARLLQSTIKKPSDQYSMKFKQSKSNLILVFDDVFRSETAVWIKIEVDFASWKRFTFDERTKCHFYGFKLPYCEMSHIH